MKTTSLAALAAAAVLALPGVASAHVTVSPEEAPAESFTRFTVNVPNERDDASTVKVTMRLPEGLTFVSFQPKPGWTRTVTTEALAEPIEVFGEQITERIATVTWTGGEIGPGEYDQFGVSARIPAEPGAELTFAALQTYSSGEVVRWIGPADADLPAPVMTVGEAEADGHAAPAGEPVADQDAVAEVAPAAAEAAVAGDDDRANTALGVSVAGLALAGGALAMALRGRRAR